MSIRFVVELPSSKFDNADSRSMMLFDAISFLTRLANSNSLRMCALSRSLDAEGWELRDEVSKLCASDRGRKLVRFTGGL